MPSLPSPRGPLSESLLGELARPPHALPEAAVSPSADPLADDDLQLALYLCYELHYRGLPSVDERWEWEPSLLSWRRGLEDVFEEALLEDAPLSDESVPSQDMDLSLREISEAEGPALSSFIGTRANLEQFREFLIHRSAYQLKEADPHSWAIPRLAGRPKAALIEIQIDEYGRGRPDWMHAALFARSMAALGLDPSYGAYLELIPGVTLATVNLMSLFGLHRRLRGAIVGHLAVFEMTSSIPNRRYSEGLRRLGFGEEATRFFDEHVTADAVHENIAAVDLAGGLAAQEPKLVPWILWGARCLTRLDGRWGAHVLDSWHEGRSSLLGRARGSARVGGAEPDQLVGAVAERLQPRLPAPAKGDGIPVGGDRRAVRSREVHRPAHE